MIKKLFLDTNVVMDLLGEREPYYNSAAKIASLADNEKIKIIVSTLTYSTVYYLLSKYEPKEIVLDKIKRFKVIIETADLTDQIINYGLQCKFSDFEDSLQYYCALEKECDVIITRNVKDFKESGILVLTPDDYLKSIKTKNM